MAGPAPRVTRTSHMGRPPSRGALAFPGLGRRMLAAELRQAERVAHLVLHRFGKAEKAGEPWQKYPIFGMKAPAAPVRIRFHRPRRLTPIVPTTVASDPDARLPAPASLPSSQRRRRLRSRRSWRQPRARGGRE